jgi:hypothetical protein
VTDLNPLSQLEVESEIRRLSDRLTRLTEKQATHAQEAAQADVDLKFKQAKVWLDLRGRGGTVAEKEAAVLTETSLYYEKAKLADAVLKADHEAGRNLRAQLDALRTLAANIRHHVAEGFGG